MKKNNVLLIVTDQFRYDCLGYAGKTPVQTPNIDSLAEDGSFFENAYTSIPTCCPARQSFYACKRSESFGAYWNYNITLPIGGLPVEEYSFMRDFEAAGYNTVYLGINELSPTHDMSEYGYKRVRDTRKEHQLKGLNKMPKFTPSQSVFDGWVDDGPLEATPTGYSASVAVEELELIAAESNDNPFFMTVCFTSPHPPYRPHRKFYDMYEEAQKWGGFDDTFENKPYIQRQMVRNWDNENRTWQDWEPIVRKYYAQVTEVDYNVGLIIKKLKESGLYDDTTIIFTADHGDMCGNHNLFDKHYILYEDVIHVPLVIKPAKNLCDSAVKRTAAYTVHNIDLGPTLMELNGIESTGKGLHGKSLAAVLCGGEGSRSEAVSTYNGTQFGLYTQRCIKIDGWKYIWNPTDVDELYDLTSDPWETVNRINDSSCDELIKQLRTRLLAILCEEGDSFCTIGRPWAAKKQLEENKKI